MANVRYWHKADIPELHCTCPLSGVKRTFDDFTPDPFLTTGAGWYDVSSDRRGDNATTRLH